MDRLTSPLRLVAGGTGRGATPPPMPPEQPMPMPAQSLRQAPKLAFTRAGRDLNALLARMTVLIASGYLTWWLGVEMHAVLDVGGMTPLEWAMLVLFCVNMAWIGTSCVSSIFGFVRLVLERPSLRRTYVPEGKTALLLPMYNEDPWEVTAAAQAILEDLNRTGAGARFDLFFLSDTTDAEVWLAEEEAFARLRAADLPSGVHYRHRLKNEARKAGNVADFCRRWGGGYAYMLVLDADSLMGGATIVEMIRRLEVEPRLGIVQSVPRLVGRSTLLGRLQQFATRVYGPVVASGLAFWHRDASNYWGHNAAIRMAAFAGYAGLPNLAGEPPFGGHILSHDFVEAALIRRAGYGVRLVTDLGGSFEDSPPTIIDLVTRDRRWAQGNLQHMKIVGAKGLHPLSRLHMVWGVLSYVASPLWLLFLLVGMALAIQAHFVPPDYFPDEFALFPHWPVIDAERAAALFGLTMAVLLLPKVLGLIAFALQGNGLVRPALSLIAETLLSALVAPILMLTQTRAVAEILLRKDSGWRPQQRADGRTPWTTLIRFHRNHVLVGLLLGVVAGLISWSLLAWMSPAVLGLVLAVPLSAMMANADIGRALRRVGLLTTPEEAAPPPVVARARALAAAAPPPSPNLREFATSPALIRRHAAWLDPGTARRPGETDLALATALLKIEEVVPNAKLLAALTPQERLAVLKHAPAIGRLHERLRRGDEG